jgi:hypothetical protein
MVRKDTGACLIQGPNNGEKKCAVLFTTGDDTEVNIIQYIYIHIINATTS